MLDNTNPSFFVNSLEVPNAAIEYAERGWRVVPLHGHDKRPRVKAWQNAATDDAEVIEGWWQRWPDSNVGIVLGEHSGIIDIECDDEKAEAALLKLFDGEFPVTPTYSASRGKHRLFKWSKEIPFQNKALFKIGKLEIRTGNGELGAQSVFPPSIHPSGKKYTWLVSPDECDVAELSEVVIAKLSVYQAEGHTEALPDKPKGKPKEHWERVAAGVQEGGRNEAAASFIGKLLSGVSDAFDNGYIALQWQLVSTWNQQIKPPLPEQELKTTFDSILGRHRQKVAAEHAEKVGTRQIDIDPHSGKQSEASWRLTQVHSTPRKWKLFSPWWEYKTLGGYIELTSTQLRTPRYIAEQAMEQASHWIDLPSFSKFWLGDKKCLEPGMADTLVATANKEECAPEENRECVLAELLMQRLANARESDEPDKKGAPRLLESDGSIWFKHGYVLSDLQYTPEPPTGKELSALLKTVGAMDKPHEFEDGSNLRFKRLDDKALARTSPKTS